LTRISIQVLMCTELRSDT